MKKLLMAMAAVAAGELGATQFYVNVTNDWFQGRQTNAPSAESLVEVVDYPYTMLILK